VAREIAGIFGKVKKEDDPHPNFTEQLAFVSPGEQQKALALADARADGADETDLGKIAPMVLTERDTAADVAMFGRMLASYPEYNREAAVSVAHAVTTHRVLVEDDYYTAVDDLKNPAEDAGAGFIGEAGFGSGVFYLYLCIDRALLLENLAGDDDVARKALEALVTACATVGPSGKAKSFASYARTSFMLAERGDGTPRTLASAFVQPVDRGQPAPNDLLEASIRTLKDTRHRFNKAYPDDAPDCLTFSVPDGQGSVPEVAAFVTEGLR
jgi:CRISPR system Cascade subunit CasC